VRCADAQGRSVPPGEPGEVLLRGYHVMQGYFEDEAATREAIDADGWLHTGDVGVMDERGYLRITDRLKDMYITGGFNCYPAEIERLLAPHPAIAQVAVIGVPDERMGEVGCAFVVSARAPAQALDERPTASPGAGARHMANYKVPRQARVRFVDGAANRGPASTRRTRCRQEAWGQPSTAACAPMKKSGSTCSFLPPRLRYWTKAFAARNRAGREISRSSSASVDTALSSPSSVENDKEISA
jgi:acyl-CoA synthetase (AMP-forming)/AMP-acid ligase II